MKEEFRDILGYEGLYQVSNLGNVKSLSKFHCNHKDDVIRGYWTKEKNLKPNRTGRYLTVVLVKDNKKKTYTIHKLVAKTFIPNNNNNFPEINHKDENSHNNCVSNLEWCTHEYNINYGSRTAKSTIKQSRKVLQYDLQGNFIKEWDNIEGTQRSLRIKNISECCRGKRKTAGGFIWKYKD